MSLTDCACGGTGVVPDPHEEGGYAPCPDCRKGEELKLTERIARVFSRLLLENIGIENLRHAIKLNEREDYKDCCASHDFCDANMVMLAAFEELNVTDCTKLTQGSPQQQAAINLWNEAWDLARTNKFYLQGI